MRLAWHIFAKDARRLWWEIAVTLGVLTMLAREDRWRSDFIPGPIEGLLNLVLPAAWAYLMALAVHQEPVVGDRQFWVTRPYPKGSLTAAKAMFALAFILLPSFLADCAVLMLRGFSPLENLGPLLWKQAGLLAAVVLPAAALAAVTGTVGQFLVVSFTLAGVAILMLENQPPWRPGEPGRLLAVVAALAAAAILILLFQYTRRYTLLSRVTGAAGVAAAALLFFYLPKETTFGMECAEGRAPAGVTIRFDPSQTLPPTILPRSRFTATLPIRVDGIADPKLANFDMLELEIELPDGTRWRTVAAGRHAPPLPDVTGHIYSPPEGGSLLSIYLPPATANRFPLNRVTVRGKFGLRLYEMRASATMSIGARAQPVPGFGLCSSMIVDEPRGNSMIKVVCESPRFLPLRSRVRLLPQQEWTHSLGDSLPGIRYPMRTPLSPLHRRQTFFHIVDEAVPGPGSRWVVPRQILDRASIEITPYDETACKVVSFEFRDVDLRPFVPRQ
jgi:hypothetical protein